MSTDEICKPVVQRKQSEREEPRVSKAKSNYLRKLISLLARARSRVCVLISVLGASLFHRGSNHKLHEERYIYIFIADQSTDITRSSSLSAAADAVAAATAAAAAAAEAKSAVASCNRMRLAATTSSLSRWLLFK